MLHTLAVILFIAWLLWVVGGYAIGGLGHLLLLVVGVLVVLGLMTGQRTLV